MARNLIVMGIIGRSPVAGVAWQALHYVEGFRRLGCDVHYLEDTGQWPYDADRNTVTDDSAYTLRYIARLMEWVGIPDRWAFRSAPENGRWYGPAASSLPDLFARADAIVNVTGATLLQEEHLRVPTRIYLETDPFLAQIEVAQGNSFTIDALGAHTHHFSFGEHLGSVDCEIPVGRFRYLPTRQPVVLDWWKPVRPDRREGRGRFTTITSWEQTGKDIDWRGDTFRWSKHLELLKFVDLPKRSNAAFELALASDDAGVISMLRANGWEVGDALALSKDIVPYREFIQGSRGEFTVAKDQYVRPRSGWFSDRSACYLASGRPVITQETGWSSIFGTGCGLHAFRTMDDVLTAIDRIESDYERNCSAAYDKAVEFFAAERVLGGLLARAGL